MSELEKNNDSKLNTSNIFDEFEVDDETRHEIEEISINKDSVYYMKKTASVLTYFNFLVFFVLLILTSYIMIEKSNSDLFNDKEYLSPICNILWWADINLLWECSSLAILNEKVDKNIVTISKEHFTKLVPILKKSYEKENSKNSKEAIFIIDKSKNKTDPILVLNEFDKLKNKFTWIDKDKIRCKDLKINNWVLEAKCSAYSTAWYTDIPWLKGEKTLNTISWTSITLASSFINYLSNSNKFDILEKQKIFETNPYFWEWNYIYMTDFKIRLKFKNNDLSL